METLKKKYMPFWLGAFVLLLVVGFVLIYPTAFTNSGVVAAISAFIGVALTVIITEALLNNQSAAQEKLLSKQSEAEVKKEFDTKKFEEKLKTFKEFLNTLCNIIKQGDNVCEQDIKELIFQIALVRMHTKGEHIEYYDIFNKTLK